MAIFQPTWVTPDVRAGLGLGVVDVTQGMTVSWHIQGSSGLVAYQVRILTNDAASTEKYDSTKTAVSPAMYGTSSSGEMLFFTHTISAADLTALSNGNEYKIIITQWWGATDAESVTQNSASVFVTRATPSLSISVSPGDTIATRAETFTATYSQAQGDVLNWFRWRIATQGNEAAPFFDSGEISGTMDISCAYDGFFSGSDYSIRLDVQTENGVEVSTGWVNFDVDYPVPTVTGGVTAGCVAGTDAVLVEWSGIGAIPGVANGPYSISADNVLSLPLLSSITWDEKGFSPMSFAAPWSIVWKFSPKGTTGGGSRTLLKITQDNGDYIEFKYSWSVSFFNFSINGSNVQLVDQITPGSTVTVVLTATGFYVRRETAGGGLYPANDLYPSDTLYPLDNDQIVALVRDYAPTYTQDAITSVVLGSPQNCYYLEVIDGTASADVIAAAITNGTYTPGVSTSDYMIADWDGGSIDGSTLDIGGDTIIGYDLYRGKDDGGALVKVAETDAETDQVYDYGALSQQGVYRYYLFPKGATTYIASPIVSSWVNPCWWNWTLMECAPTASKNIFTVLNAYRFRLNIETAAMSNSNSPNLLQNFTPYPKVQLAPQNYKQSSLTGLIGAVDWSSGQPQYKDTIELRDEIYALSTTQNALFLKSRKGDLIRVRISGAITMQTGDATKEQMQTATIPWVEVGSAAGVSLYSLSFAGVQEQEGEYVPQYYVDASDATADEANIRIAKTAYGPNGKIIGDASVSVEDGSLILPAGMKE